MWLVWLEHNRRTFQDIQRNVSWIESRLLVVLYGWLEMKIDPDMFSFLEFLDGVIG